MDVDPPKYNLQHNIRYNSGHLDEVIYLKLVLESTVFLRLNILTKDTKDIPLTYPILVTSKDIFLPECFSVCVLHWLTSVVGVH